MDGITDTPVAQPTEPTAQPIQAEPNADQTPSTPQQPQTQTTETAPQEPVGNGLLGGNDGSANGEGEQVQGGGSGDGTNDPEPNTTLGAPEEGYSQEAMKEADGEIASAFMNVAKELNLSQEAVDKLYGAVAPVMRKRSADMLAHAEQEWSARAKADPEYGGTEFAKNQGRMAKAYAKYASPELKQVLRESRLDCHPEVLRMFYRISNDISEDVILKGSGSTERTGRSNDPRDMYPNTKMNL